MDELDLTNASVTELGRLYRRILPEMRDRRVIRTGDAPIGDYTEWLVAQSTGGELAPNSQKAGTCAARKVSESRSSHALSPTRGMLVSGSFHPSAHGI